MPSRRHKYWRVQSERGFVLAMTLWFLAIATMAAGYFADRVSLSVSLADQAQRMSRASIEQFNTRAEILFRLATTPFTPQGLGLPPNHVIALNDRVYKGSGDDRIRIQDAAGLVNLNFGDRVLLNRLLTAFGIPAEKIPALFDALADFIDADNLRRLNGAEAAEYNAAGLPPPPNDVLATPFQLRAVYGWAGLNELWSDGRFLTLLSVSRVNGFNPDTAPKDLLAILPAGNKQIAQSIVQLRQTDPVKAGLMAMSLARVSGLDQDSLLYLPSNSLRITQESRDIPWGFQFSVTLTPGVETAPWRIDYMIKTQVKSESSNDVPPAPPLPPIETAAPVAAATQAM